jgi:hypothetical protein
MKLRARQGREVPAGALRMAKSTKTHVEKASRDASLQREQAVFDANLVEWLSDHAGKYVLIKGSEVDGFYESRDQALAAGYARFGFGPLLVKQVLRSEPVYDIPSAIF